MKVQVPQHFWLPEDRIFVGLTLRYQKLRTSKHAIEKIEETDHTGLTVEIKHIPLKRYFGTLVSRFTVNLEENRETQNLTDRSCRP